MPKEVEKAAVYISTMNSCIVPAQGCNDGDDRWMSIHKQFLADQRDKDPDVVVLGDCIFDTLRDSEIWNQYFAPLHCLNFSIRNERTEQILWRIENGTLDGVKPKIVVLHVGTNNVENTAEEISAAILEIISKIRCKLPDAYILLPTLLPRGQQPNQLRDKINKVNFIVKEKIVGMNKVQSVEIGNGLVQGDGSISHHDMFDYKNLTSSGAKKVLEPLYELLSQILNENEKEKDLTPSE